MAFERKTVDRMQIYLTSGVFLKNQPLYEAIFMEAKKLGIAGATVDRCVMGYGPENLIRGKTPLMPANDLPMRIEIIDEHEKIDLILPFLEKHLKKGIAVRSNVDILISEAVLENTEKIKEILKEQQNEETSPSSQN